VDRFDICGPGVAKPERAAIPLPATFLMAHTAWQDWNVRPSPGFCIRGDLLASLLFPGETLIAASQPYVLVVEDEFFSRMHAADLVEAAGYRPIEVSNAYEAIAILEARKDILIVFTDIDMPGSTDGLKLARAIRDRWPPIELILTSGHFDVPEGDIPERGLFFSKPYRDNEIVSALRRFAS
jgi:CheY-like chemotaxis protein